MKLAVITDEIDTDIAHALDVMAEYDIYNAELRAIGDSSISRMSIAEIEGVRRILDAKAARAIGIASPFYKTDLPGTGSAGSGPLHGAATLSFDEQLNLLRHLIAAAKILDAPYIRTFTFWKQGLMTEQIEDSIVDAYAEPARLAEDAGLVLLIENEPSCYVGTGVETARVVSRVDSPAVKIVWDPANAVFAGESPFPRGYEAVRRDTVHVHVKDAARVQGEVECVPVGEGDVDWRRQLCALDADNYTGYLSLETHYDGLASRELSSRQSLENLIRMVNDLD